MTRIRPSSIAWVLLSTLLWPAAALAYPPFDGTDADVLEPDEFELESAPALGATEGSTLAPETALIAGVAPGIELSAEARQIVGAASGVEVSFPHFDDTALLTKALLRRGSLQDHEGPSVAIEAGLMLPSSHVLDSDARPRAVGGSGALIVSQSIEPLTLHANASFEHDPESVTVIAASVIVDTPEALVVRPVAELGVAGGPGDGPELSGLVGTIWQLRSNLSVAMALKTIDAAGDVREEVRLGFVWTTSRVHPD